MRAMLDTDRLSLAAIAFSSSRSSSDNRITTGFFEAIPRGNRDRLICLSSVIMLYCDPLSYECVHYLQKSAICQQGIAKKCKSVIV